MNGMEEEDDGGRPEGYRVPARTSSVGEVFYREILGDSAVDAIGENAPAVRMANAILLNGIRARAELIRVQTAGVEFEFAGTWHDEVALPADMAGNVIRRLKLMASLPTEPSAEPIMADILLYLSDTAEHEVLLRVLVRPCVVGERLLVRIVPTSERAALAWNEPDRLEEVENQFRWELERLSRLVRIGTPTAVATAAGTLVTTARTLLPASYRVLMDVHTTLATLALESGDRDAASREIEATIEVAVTYGARRIAIAALLQKRAELHADRGDLTGAAETLQEAAELVELCLGRRDPYVGSLLAQKAEYQATAGHVPEALATYDEAITLVRGLTGEDDLALRALVTARGAVAGKAL